MRKETHPGDILTNVIRRVRRVLSRTAEPAQHRVIPQPPVAEPITATEVNFPSTNYHYWRDALQHLQQGHSANAMEKDIVLPDETLESSNWIGTSANWLARDMIVGLREGRVDSDGQPYVLCIDEASDKQVFANATPNERQTFLIRAIGRIPRTLWLADDERQRAYVIAAVGLAEAFLHQTPEVARETVAHAINLSNFGNFSDLGQRLHTILAKIPQTPIDHLLTYIAESPQRLIAEERAYIAEHGPREYGSFEDAYLEAAQTGKPLGLLEGQVRVPRGYELQEDEIQLFSPLRAAVHSSRTAMVSAAITLADRLYGLEPSQVEAARTKLSQAWREGENLEGLRSDQLLVYIPAGTTRIPLTDGPKCFYKQPGWYLYRVSYEGEATRYVPKLLK